MPELSPYRQLANGNKALAVVNDDGTTISGGGGSSSAVLQITDTDDTTELPVGGSANVAVPTRRTTAAGVAMGEAANPDVVHGPAAAGELATGNPVPMGGTDGTNRVEAQFEATTGGLKIWDSSKRNAADDRVSAVHDTAAIGNAGTLLVPKFAAIAAATSGNNTLLAAVTSKKIRVLSLFLVAGAAGNIYFTSATGGTVIFGGSTNKIQLAANGGFVLPFSPVGWFETVAGELLAMNASSTGPFSGGFCYVEV